MGEDGKRGPRGDAGSVGLPGAPGETVSRLLPHLKNPSCPNFKACRNLLEGQMLIPLFLKEASFIFFVLGSSRKQRLPRRRWFTRSEGELTSHVMAEI